jgi:hypothetical protein
MFYYAGFMLCSFPRCTVFAAFIALALLGQAEPTTPAYLDPALPLETRVSDLVSRLTVEEKAALMMNGSPGVPRLGVPKYDWWNEALHGVARAGEATVFPQAIGLAAMWDEEFMLTVADTISTEARAKHHEAVRQNNRAQYYGLTFWTPNKPTVKIRSSPHASASLSYADSKAMTRVTLKQPPALNISPCIAVRNRYAMTSTSRPAKPIFTTPTYPRSKHSCAKLALKSS